MRVLVACEASGVVRDAFRRRGHDAVSCDLRPSDVGGPHHQGDVLELLADGWDLMIAHPPCTYLCSSGLHWNTRRPEREALTEEALAFVARLLLAPVPRIALENPRGRIGTRIRPADQTVQPHQFGGDASKATCLWLKNLPRLRPTRHVPSRLVVDAATLAQAQLTLGGIVEPGRQRWSNQTDSGQNRLAPSPTRWIDRSRTYPGLAEAMADQWGGTA